MRRVAAEHCASSQRVDTSLYILDLYSLMRGSRIFPWQEGSLLEGGQPTGKGGVIATRVPDTIQAVYALACLSCHGHEYRRSSCMLEEEASHDTLGTPCPSRMYAQEWEPTPLHSASCLNLLSHALFALDNLLHAGGRGWLVFLHSCHQLLLPCQKSSHTEQAQRGGSEFVAQWCSRPAPCIPLFGVS